MAKPKDAAKVLAAVKRAVRDKYAWPGGYPLHVVMNDGECLCVECARAEFRQIAWETINGLRGGWRAAGSDVNWEDSDLRCAHCNSPIESAYGEPAATKESN